MSEVFRSEITDVHPLYKDFVSAFNQYDGRLSQIEDPHTNLPVFNRVSNEATEKLATSWPHDKKAPLVFIAKNGGAMHLGLVHGFTVETTTVDDRVSHQICYIFQQPNKDYYLAVPVTAVLVETLQCFGGSNLSAEYQGVGLHKHN